ncbi:MAG TPA: DUF3365 domain-containing protein [Anaeromyxobacter sp.]
MLRTLLAFTVAAAAGGAPPAAEPPRPLSVEEIPRGWAPAVSRGDAAMNVLRERFLKRLQAAFQAGGVQEALTVCPVDAPRIAKEVGEANHVEIGRTSFRVRNPANAPRPWAASFVAAAAGKKVDEMKPAVFDLGDRIGMLRAMATMPLCVRCHGAAEAIAPEVKAELAKRYPKDQGLGFAAGDVRGFIWVEVKKP